jgi:hypothetical protein
VRNEESVQKLTFVEGGHGSIGSCQGCIRCCQVPIVCNGVACLCSQSPGRADTGGEPAAECRPAVRPVVSVLGVTAPRQHHVVEERPTPRPHQGDGESWDQACHAASARGVLVDALGMIRGMGTIAMHVMHLQSRRSSHGSSGLI